eukprot:CAMPEP_0201983052 /NCGR_PEP_ID=MMETSP0904-20121228/79018_1 /ASSEMBLY_ACC=CAM_ASM_000553 /TAXON_ID=420261 /ORGANISM="Thalassiosira antarctica, Strain CCMP982" /LENGTH=135 /DNA_ID=CAMNT_0048536067 /DNA_START=127 /DNA_END=534 /DNA_ORIENTATION=-
MELARQLIDCYPEAIEKQDHRGRLPLHYALRYNAPLQIIQSPEEMHPDSELVEDKQGSTSVHLACRFGSSENAINIWWRNQVLTWRWHSNGRTTVSWELVGYLIGLNKTAFTMPDNRGELPQSMQGWSHTMHTRT